MNQFIDRTGAAARPARALDARVALSLVAAYSVAIFFVHSWQAMALFGAALLVVLAALRINVARVMQCIVPLLFILAFTVVAHIPQGLDEGLFYAVRILLLAFATLTVAFSYDDTQLIRAFSAFMRPLRAVCVPVDDIATMFSIAVRFIPTLMDEFHRIVNAQKARCGRFDEGSVVERVRQYGTVLVPMLIGLFRRAGVLAQAMESRCYGHEGPRTSLHGRKRLSVFEICAIIVGAALCFAIALLL